MIPLLVFQEQYKDLISMHNKRFDHYKVRNILTMSFRALKKFEIQDLQDPSFRMIPSYWGVSLSPLFTSKVLAFDDLKIKSKRGEGEWFSAKPSSLGFLCFGLCQVLQQMKCLFVIYQKVKPFHLLPKTR